MDCWTTYSLSEGTIVFLRGKKGDNDIHIGYGSYADISFLADYDAVIGPTWSDNDGMYWGMYHKKGCEHADECAMPDYHPAMPTSDNYKLDDGFMEGDTHSEPDYESGWSTLSVETDNEEYESLSAPYDGAEQTYSCH